MFAEGPTLRQTWFNFIFAISGWGSLPVDCWMFHLFHTFGWERKGRASRRTLTLPAHAGNTGPELKEPAREAKPASKQPRVDKRPALHHNGTASETLIISDGENLRKPSQGIGDHPVWTWPISHEHSFDRNSYINLRPKTNSSLALPKWTRVSVNTHCERKIGSLVVPGLQIFQ